MSNSESLILYAVMLTALLHTSFASNDTTKYDDTVIRQPRYSRQEGPILLIRPVTKESTTLMRLPINRKTNPIPMAPMIGNGFVIRTKTDDEGDDETLVKEFISHFGKVVTRTDHGNNKKTEVFKSPIRHISLPSNVNYFIKNIQGPQPNKRFSTQPSLTYRRPAPMVMRQRPAGFLKKRNIRTETFYQMTPQFRASPQIPVESRPLTEGSSSSDDWNPTSSHTSATIMHATENRQYQNPLFIKSQKEKFAYTQHLMERPIKNAFNDDDYSLPKSKPTQTSFSSMTIALDDDNKIPSFKPKVSLRVAADGKIKNRTRLKPVREYQDESRKLNTDHESDQDKNGEENVPSQFDSVTPAPLFVTPIEVAATKSSKLLKHRSSPKFNDSCEVTCLMNIINLDYDPLCGSNDETYANVGKFRCAKICGQLHLTIKHFGSCEDTKPM